MMITPYNENAEQSVLGAVLLEPNIIKTLQLEGYEFYLPQNKELFTLLKKMDENNIPIDVTTISAQLNANQLDAIGGLTYLMQLASSVPTVANTKQYEVAVIDCYKRRVMIEESNRIMLAASEGDGTEELTSIINKLQVLSEDKVSTSSGDTEPITEKLFEKYSRPIESGIMTGITDLDKLMQGFKLTDLNILAARPGVGKTAMLVQMAIGMAQSNDNVIPAVFSLEMSDEMLVERFISNMGMIDNYKNSNPFVKYDERDWRSFSRAIGDFNNLNIKIFEGHSTRPKDVRNTVSNLQKRYPDKIIVPMIDYLQLMSPDERKGNREQEVASISRGLKHIATEFKTSVIALSQLSRGLEQRQDKSPLLSDLRESGSLEQDASTVIFLHRDDYYDKECDNAGQLEVKVSKNRHGGIGTIIVAYEKQFSKMINIDWSVK